MLKQMRNALKGVVAWIVIILLILAFALWGVPEVQNFTRRAPLEVGKVAFSQQAILEEFNRQIASRRQETGSYTREQALADGVPDRVIESIAARSVLEQEADRLGLVMPIEVVRDYLQNDERFQNPTTGRFDEFVLRSILTANSMSVRSFEAAVRQDQLRAQLVEAVAVAGAPPTAMTTPMLLREVEQRKIAYIVVSEALAEPAAEPTPEQLDTYYRDNPATFTAPEYRVFTVVDLRNDNFREGLSAPEEDLRRIYEANRARLYDEPEKRTVYQITYDNEAEATAAAAALRAGKPFENVASDRGLSLAAVTFTDITRADLLDPGVAEAAFTAGGAPGAISDPVKSLFGWTVVQIASITPARSKSFEEARPDIEREFLAQDTRRRIIAAIDELEEARDAGASLSVAAERAGLTYRRFGPVDAYSFEPGGAILADIPGEALTAAFRLDEGEESEALERTDKNGYIFVQVDEVTPAAVKPFDVVAQDVERRWREADRKRRVGEAAQKLKDAVAGGKSFDDAALALNRAALVETVSRGQSNETFSPALMREIFRAPVGAVVSGSAELGVAETVVEVREVGFARSRIGPGEEVGFAQYVGYQINQELLEAYLETLRRDFGVKSNPQAVRQIFSDAQ